MSHSEIARFPHQPMHPKDNDPEGAQSARQRIAGLHDAYLNHAAPNKENLAGEVKPVSPAADKSARAIPLNAEAPVAPVVAKAAPATEAQPIVTHGEAQPAPVIPIVAANPLESGASLPVAAPAPATSPRKTADPSDVDSKYKLPSPVRPLLTAAGIFVLLLLVFKAPILLSQLSYLTQSKTPAISATQTSTAVPAAPLISIPKINVSAPISFPTTTADAPNYDPELENGVVHLPGTALPGQIGNTVIFGHSSNDWWEPGNYKFVFVLLDKLQAGDTFSLNYNSKQYIYQVTGTEIVDPTAYSIVNPTADAEATIFTCTPPGTSWKRFVVHAKQISPAPTAQTAKATTTSTQTGGTLPSNAPSITDKVGGWWNGLVHALGLGGGSTSGTSASGTTSSAGTNSSGASPMLPAN